MQNETRQCQSCKKGFVIEPIDFEFYAKIQVPSPTFCPTCRLKRRMVFLNEHTLYKRACYLCKEDFISFLPKDSPHTVYCARCFWDKWDPGEYARDYDFSKPFFQQYKELLAEVPHTGQQLITPTIVNSNYCCIASHLKNCYFIFNSDYDEDCAYGTCLERSKNSTDMYMSDECEWCYEGVNLSKCSRTCFSYQCESCYDVYFSENLQGCTNCVGCVNLRNKNYYIFNEPYSKEGYQAKVAELGLGSYQSIRKIQEKVGELSAALPKRYMNGTHNTNVSGEYISHSKNVKDSYQVVGAEEIRYSQFLFIEGAKDCYDFTMWGGNAVMMYENMGAGGGQNNVRFCFECWCEGHDYEYCMELGDMCSDIFGCYSLHSKSYCILNKQYTKEEYFDLLPKIKQHMIDMPYTDSHGHVYRYGEFFPPELSWFGYNESLANEHFPMTKEEARSGGFGWRDKEIKQYTVTVKTEDIPDDIKDVSDTITTEIIGCAHAGACAHQCSTAFKIIPEELAALKRLNLPLPRLCPQCRHQERLTRRNHMKMHHAKCMKEGCQNEFETAYTTEGKEIIYCEKCYQQEVM